MQPTQVMPMRDEVRAFGLLLGVGFRAAPVLSAVTLLLGVVQGVAVPLQAFGISVAVDGLMSRDGSTLIAGLVLLGALFAANLALFALDVPITDTLTFKARSRLRTDLMRTIGGIPAIEHHENPDVADRIQLLHRDSGRMSFAVRELLGFVAIGTNVATIVVLLMTVSPWLLLLLVVGSVRVVTSFLDSRLQWGAIKATMQEYRLANRLQQQTRAAANAVEMRVFGLRPMLLHRLDEGYGKVECARAGAALKGARYEIASRLLFGAAYFIAIVYVAVQVHRGSLNSGAIALVVLLGSGIEQTVSGITSITGGIGETVRLFGLYAWLRRYAAQQRWDDSTRPAPARLTHGIEFRHVGFRYPSAERDVLSEVDLFLPAGSTVALVGENGSGKSTLVKLLARLYDPTRGSVLVDGTDLREIAPDGWRRVCAATFQDFAKFEFTAARSVGVGDLDRIDNAQSVRTAMKRGDAVEIVDGLPDGVHTQLGKQFTDGVDLSGGQWQRLALARGFMRDRPLLLLLDEPTAALDPEAEHRLYDQFAAASRTIAREAGSITVLVSHRFSTVRMADLIVVMEGGRIVEIGTHETLLSNNNRYAELFDLQARAYRY